VPANEIHHRRALADGGAIYDHGNLLGLCKGCHSSRTRSGQ
jgi:hypothetical protein